jgi:hypothetical protein
MDCAPVFLRQGPIVNAAKWALQCLMLGLMLVMASMLALAATPAHAQSPLTAAAPLEFEPRWVAFANDRRGAEEQGPDGQRLFYPDFDSICRAHMLVNSQEYVGFTNRYDGAELVVNDGSARAHLLDTLGFAMNCKGAITEGLHELTPYWARPDCDTYDGIDYGLDNDGNPIFVADPNTGMCVRRSPARCRRCSIHRERCHDQS